MSMTIGYFVISFVGYMIANTLDGIQNLEWYNILYFSIGMIVFIVITVLISLFVALWKD